MSLSFYYYEHLWWLRVNFATIGWLEMGKKIIIKTEWHLMVEVTGVVAHLGYITDVIIDPCRHLCEELYDMWSVLIHNQIPGESVKMIVAVEQKPYFYHRFLTCCECTGGREERCNEHWCDEEDDKDPNGDTAISEYWRWVCFLSNGYVMQISWRHLLYTLDGSKVAII